MSGYKVGDLVVVVLCENRPELIGREATIIHHLVDSWWTLDLQLDGEKWSHWNEFAFRRKPPKSDYDGNQAGSWDLIPWQPNKMREQA